MNRTAKTQTYVEAADILSRIKDYFKKNDAESRDDKTWSLVETLPPMPEETRIAVIRFLRDTHFILKDMEAYLRALEEQNEND
jgi:hypothetical protein